jgi:hypothetical protein
MISIISISVQINVNISIWERVRRKSDRYWKGKRRKKENDHNGWRCGSSGRAPA